MKPKVDKNDFLQYYHEEEDNPVIAVIKHTLLPVTWTKPTTSCNIISAFISTTDEVMDTLTFSNMSAYDISKYVADYDAIIHDDLKQLTLKDIHTLLSTDTIPDNIKYYNIMLVSIDSNKTIVPTTYAIDKVKLEYPDTTSSGKLILVSG